MWVKASRLLRATAISSAVLAFVLCRIAFAKDKVNLSSWSDITKLFVELESESLALDGGYQSGRVIRRTMAVTSTNNVHYFIGHGFPGRRIDWRDEPFNLRITASAQKVYECQLFNRCFEETALPLGSELPLAIQNDTFLHFAPVWPAMNYASPRSRYLEKIVAADAIASEKYTSKSLIVNGENCVEYRATDGSDRIVMSTEKENCVLLRECFDPMSKAKISSMVTIEVAHIRGALWIPSKVEFAYFESDGAAERLYRRAVTRVLDVRLNEEVSDSLFEQELGAGYIQVEDKESRSFRQVAAGGADHLGRLANWCRVKLGLPERDSLWERYIRSVFLFIIGLVSGAILSCPRPTWRH
jgi:hypothetical protein